MPVTAHQLDYGLQPRPVRRWLRLFWRPLLLVAITAIISAILYRPALKWYQPFKDAKHRAIYEKEMTAWYQIAASRAVSKSTVTYVESKASGVESGGSWSSSDGAVDFRSTMDQSVIHIPSIDSNGDLGSYLAALRLVYSGKRTNPAGIKQLILVDLGDWNDMSLSFSTRGFGLVKNGNAVAGYGLVRQSFGSINMEGIAAPGTLRLFGGYPDPVDPAAFFVPFESSGKHGLIQGKFLADQTIKMTATLSQPPGTVH